MKNIVKTVVLGSFLVLLAAAFAPGAAACWPDDMAGFYIPAPMQVGSVVLEPGTYTVRAIHAFPGHNVLAITSPDGMKVYTTVLATPHVLAQQEIQNRSRLLYAFAEDGSPWALRTFLVANSSFGYDIHSRQLPTRQAKAVTKELVAVAESR